MYHLITTTTTFIDSIPETLVFLKMKISGPFPSCHLPLFQEKFSHKNEFDLHESGCGGKTHLSMKTCFDAEAKERKMKIAFVNLLLKVHACHF